MDKEPFYLSVRFWVAVLTPVLAALIEIGAKYIPGLSQLPQDVLTTIIATLVVSAVTYVVARTLRNTKAR